MSHIDDYVRFVKTAKVLYICFCGNISDDGGNVSELWRKRTFLFPSTPRFLPNPLHLVFNLSLDKQSYVETACLLFKSFCDKK